MHIKKRTAFTLIELLVVVFVIAIASGFLLPVLIKARDKARRIARNKKEQQFIKPRSKEQKSSFIPPEGIVPIIDSIDLKMSLLSKSHRLGMDVYTRYEAHCMGKMVFQHPGDPQKPLLISIPLPQGTTEARDVKLTLSMHPNEKPREPDNVIYNQHGIFWSGVIPGSRTVCADINFIAIGRENFIYNLPNARQMRSVQITLDMKNVDSPTIPDNALQPTGVDGPLLNWVFNNLVSDRAIIIEIPGTRSPLGKVMLLFRLMAVAVLLFGAGFWYLNELVRPGQLDDFRWGHFFLLALNYSLFFIIFSVLGFHGTINTWAAMVISAVFSLPLLVLHVSRIVGLKFTLSRILPLAIFTLALVVNGVYGEQLRDYLFIAATIFIVTYLTLTYNRWAAGREAYRQKRRKENEEKRKLLIDKIGSEIGTLITEAEADLVKAKQLLKCKDPESLDSARKNLNDTQRRVASILKEHRRRNQYSLGVPSVDDWNFKENFNSLEKECNTLQDELKQALSNLKNALNALKESRKSLVGEQIESQTYCAACGKPGPQTPYCQECGTQRVIPLICKECGECFSLPVHLIDKNNANTIIHCVKCGTVHDYHLPAALKQKKDEDPLKVLDNISEENDIIDSE